MAKEWDDIAVATKSLGDEMMDPVQRGTTHKTRDVLHDTIGCDRSCGMREWLVVIEYLAKDESPCICCDDHISRMETGVDCMREVAYIADMIGVVWC